MSGRSAAAAPRAPLQRSALGATCFAVAGTLLLALPLALVGAAVTAQGALGEVDAKFVTQALVALDRGQLERLGFAFPPLPLVLLALYPTPLASSLWGAFWVGALAFLLIKDALERERRFLILGVAALFLSPVALNLAGGNYGERMALFLLFWAWLRYVRWSAAGLSVYGFEAGLILGVAVFVTPLAVPLALTFGAALPAFRPMSLGAYLTGWLILVFPALAGLMTWAYMGWLFTGELTWLYAPPGARAEPLWLVLLFSPLYVAAGFRLLLNPSVRLLVYLFPLGLLFASRLFGVYSLAFEVMLLSIFALGALSRQATRPDRALLLAGAAAQLVVAYLAFPWPAAPPEGALEQAVGRTLATADARAVLSDDATAYRAIAWAGTARPFLLPVDASFHLALAAPAAHVRYAFVCPGDSALYRRYGERPPEGFALEWTYNGCRFYRAFGAPPLQHP
ncbi:hypothetical protein [Truepera radiovictrix]|uniref:Glycosyltransferase RgtA/B/C/D-like domain-containing protein n=1 Tax=Truepera radiovictrix (strain DSM 17093 / CIP 108686 / LMG 22925 / RQ-24) TaxID=649638 RepID=D7CX54_TRURR|nr:hypothetical protein [Truepera radiovictrix]ADI14562.1 conserved hypothetical protein [Truepera radiovictrix DSM 17093]WMT56888.1 hypothetical protein RCV51_12825 [Truepera radiovictrix]